MPSINVNKETIAFAMGLIGLATVGWNAVSYFKSLEPQNNPIVREIQVKNIEQDKRLDRTDEDRANNTAAIKEQTIETQRLKEAVVKLTTAIEGKEPTRKADLDRIPIPDFAVGIE